MQNRHHRHPIACVAAALLSAVPSYGISATPIGINLSSNNDWNTSEIWADVTHMFRAWGQPDLPWNANPNLQFTPDGYPLQSAGTLTYLRDYPDGVYKLTYQGTGTVTFGGQGSITNVTRVGTTTTADVIVNHSKGELLTMSLTGIAPDDPVHDLHLLAPGSRPGQVFTDAFLRRVQPFTDLRFMDWQATNGNTLQNWSDRPTAQTFIQTSGSGVALEYVVALANEAAKDPWITVPVQATDDYVRNMAHLIHQSLAPGRTVYVEYSNELWNSSFPQYKTNVSNAKANPVLTDTDDFGRAAQQAAFRSKQIKDIFRDEFGSDADRVKVVLGGFVANSYYASEGLKFLQAKYGDARSGVDAVAIAPYLTLSTSQDATGLTLDGLFAALNQNLSGIASATRSAATMASGYGLPLMSYEGGQGIVNWNSVAGAYINQSVKAAAEHDPRMGDVLTRLVDIWGQNGGGLFNQYSFVSLDSNSGYWGLLQNMNDQGSPKWDAMMRLALPMGDATLDGVVDTNDLGILLSNYGKSGMWWEQGDFNGDGRVNADDLALFDRSLLQLGLYRSGAVVVPEPRASVAGLIAVGLLFSRRRRATVRIPDPQ